MKTILILLILSSALAMPAIGALDDADLNKIRLIVNEVVKKEITDSETRMKEYIDLKIDGVDKQFEGVDKQFEGVDKQFEGVGKQITLLTNVVYGLIALIVAAIAIPQIIMAWRSGKDREQARINQELREEIETLKQQRIVQP